MNPADDQFNNNNKQVCFAVLHLFTHIHSHSNSNSTQTRNMLLTVFCQIYIYITVTVSYACIVFCALDSFHIYSLSSNGFDHGKCRKCIV